MNNHLVMEYSHMLNKLSDYEINILYIEGQEDPYLRNYGGHPFGWENLAKIFTSKIG